MSSENALRLRGKRRDRMSPVKTHDPPSMENVDASSSGYAHFVELACAGVPLRSPSPSTRRNSESPSYVLCSMKVPKDMCNEVFAAAASSGSSTNTLVAVVLQVPGSTQYGRGRPVSASENFKSAQSLAIFPSSISLNVFTYKVDGKLARALLSAFSTSMNR